MNESGPAAKLVMASVHSMLGLCHFSLSYMASAFGDSSMWKAFSLPDFYFLYYSSEINLAWAERYCQK